MTAGQNVNKQTRLLLPRRNVDAVTFLLGAHWNWYNVDTPARSSPASGFDAALTATVDDTRRLTVRLLG